MISADVKANKNNEKFLKYNIKGACIFIFHLILVGFLSILISSVKNRGGGGGVA